MIGELLKYDRGTNNEHDKHAAIDGGNLFNKTHCTDQGTGPGCSRLLIKQSHDIRRFPMIIFVKIP